MNRPRLLSLYTYRGKRIRPSDKNLVVKSFSSVLVPLFLLILLAFHFKWLGRINWGEFSLIRLGENEGVFPPVNLQYLITSLSVAGAVCTLLGALYVSYRVDQYKQLEHRQMLARMVLENGWYESVTDSSGGWFKDISSSSNKERITSFPKIYYQMKGGILTISVRVTLGRYQSQLLDLEEMLEAGLFCELIERVQEEPYIVYRLLYDTIASRIPIEEAVAENGRLRLMENLYWEFDDLPHMLIAGGTGGGKTYFLLSIIEALAGVNAKQYILDPKNADLADLSAVMPDVHYRADDIIACIERFYEDMMVRNESMKKMPGYVTGKNYAYLGLEPNFLVFDEFPAFMNMIGRQSQDVMQMLSKIVMLGRQSGFFVILACQRPDAKYLGDGIRDQFNFRVALGKMYPLGYSMMFGEVSKQFFYKHIKGRGYADSGMGVISEFYTPEVDKGHDFLAEIGRRVQQKQGVLTDDTAGIALSTPAAK